MSRGLANSRNGCTTLVELLRWRALHQPDQWAYTFLINGENEGLRLTYQELDRQARTIGALLQDWGAAGERVLLLYPQGLEYIIAFFGCLYAGAVAVPSYPPRLNRSDPRLQAIAVDAQARLALTTSQILSNLERRLTHTPALEALHWLATDDLLNAPSTSSGQALAEKWRAPVIESHTLAFLQYTSGSTAVPKGVMVSHGNILHNERMIQRAFEDTEQSTFVVWLPIYHDMGLIGNVIQSLYIGAHCILMSPLDYLQKPFRWLQAISHYQADVSGGPNFAYDLCVRKITPEQRATLDLSSWEVAFNGAEPVRHQTLERFTATFESCGFRRKAFYPCYGLAEATLLVSGGLKSAPPAWHAVQRNALEHGRVNASALGEAGSRMLVNCGCTRSKQKIVIVDHDFSKTCAPDQVGEIWVSGASVAQGYWNRPEETKRIFCAYLADNGEGPFLRTGDLGFLKDGGLFITGRIKDLIIVRGCNHDPQEIELTVEQSHPVLQPGSGAAFSVEVAGEERLVIVQEVLRFHRKPDVDAVAAVVRQAVACKHKLHVYAVVLIEPMTLPKTSSGKIQRHVCKARFLDGSLKTVGSSILEYIDHDSHAWKNEWSIGQDILLCAETEVDRRSLIESWLQEQIAQVLRITSSQLNSQQPISTLGIDSLMAIELQNRFEAFFGMNMPAVKFLEDQSIVQMAAQLIAQPTTVASKPPVPPAAICRSVQSRRLPDMQLSPRNIDQPLSFEQERLWLLDQLIPGNPAYNIPLVIHFAGQLDLGMLEQSLTAVGARHEAFRTTFVAVHGQPTQVVAPVLTLKLSIVDLCALSGIKQNAETHRLAAQEAQHSFVLARGPLVRVVLLRLDDEEHVMILTMHHIIADVWSQAVLIRELVASYDAFAHAHPAAFPKLPIQYVDFARWQRKQFLDERMKDQLSYWKERLKNMPLESIWWSDRPRAIGPDFQGGHYFFNLSSSLPEMLRHLNRTERVTPFMTLLAAFLALLQHCTKQEDILVGCPIRGRNHPETINLIGFFAYPLMLRTDLSGDPTFREILSRTRKETMQAYAHSEVPFSKIVEAVRTGEHGNARPFLQMMFNLVQTPLENVELSALRLSLLNFDSGVTDLDLFLTVVEEAGGLRGVLGYRATLFNAKTIEHLADFYCRILEQGVAHPETKLSQFKPSRELENKVENTERRDGAFTIAIAGTFTTEPLEESLKFWMNELNWHCLIQFAPYHQVFQQLLDPSSLFAQNSNGINLVLIRFEDWCRFENGSGLNTPLSLSAAGCEKIERNVYDLIGALTSAVRRSAVPYLACICPASPPVMTDMAGTAFVKRMEKQIIAGLTDLSGIYLVTPAELAARYSVPETYDAGTDTLGHIPYTSVFFSALGTMIARKIHSIRNAPYKVIVLDCDRTLWKGVCAEDSPLGIEIDAPHRALQEFMVAQYHAGMLICLCSKNNEVDLNKVFEHRPEMPLKREHIVSRRVNWQPKSENIRSLAEELQLGVDSFIFIDDDPVECAEVQAHCPEVLTLQLPQKADDIPLFLDHIWAFDHLQATAADENRTNFYHQDLSRKRFNESAATFEDFLSGLELEIHISALQPQSLSRAAQLTQRTNQFNCTAIRRTESEIQSLCLSGLKECAVVEVHDRFGDYGLVGVMIFEATSDALQVDTFLLSCRALGRRVERHMLAWLGKIAASRGMKHVNVVFYPTEKNQPALNFLEEVGMPFKHSHRNGYLFAFPVPIIMELLSAC